MVLMNFITEKLSYMVYIAWQPGQQSHTSLGNFLSLQSPVWGFWPRVSERHRTEFNAPLMWGRHSFFHSGPTVGNHGLPPCTTLRCFLFLLLFFFLYMLTYNIITMHNKYNKEELGERKKTKPKQNQNKRMRERLPLHADRQQWTWRVVTVQCGSPLLHWLPRPGKGRVRHGSSPFPLKTSLLNYLEFLLDVASSLNP